MRTGAGPAGEPREGRRIKVAVLGGGCGGLATAWALTATPALRERFEVTVYERSWQLGGKGASGRAPLRANGHTGYRIQEHGLHVWFGFYAHAFRMLRGAYEEAGLATGADWWRVAFERCDAVSLYEQRPDRTWIRQPVRLPRRGGADAGPPIVPRQLLLGRVLARTIRLLATGVRAELGTPTASRGARRDGEEAGGAAIAAAATLDVIAAELGPLESNITLADDEPVGAAWRGHPAGRDAIGAPTRNAVLERLLGELSGHVGDLRRQVHQGHVTDRARFWRGVLELASAALTGIVRDGVLWRGLGTVDEEDLRRWLVRHGASVETVRSSPVLQGLYDLTFAYRGGDKRCPSLAAGKGVQSLLMMVNYEGSFMWRMRAGMGDVVFAPLYLALRRRGVSFQFFTEVTGLRVVAGDSAVTAIDIRRVAAVRRGADAYEPIERLGGWWCWPAAPDGAQLMGGAAPGETLTRGDDFDEVVLAIPVGALAAISEELMQANPRFKMMIDRAETVRTQGLQLWLNRTIDELRGVRATDGLDPPATAFAEPFDTYCDMSHLLEVEGSSGHGAPQAVAYFCAVLPDTPASDTAHRSVREGARRYLERDIASVWPVAVKDGTFDWDVLFDPEDRVGRDRLAAQYLRANVDASDRYVTTPAGSVAARLDPGDSGFENLVLAGDWTHSGIDGGCVEAAVISGERAAEALRGRSRQVSQARPPLAPYVEFGALATAPGPLECDLARLYCFVLRTEHAAVQRLCDRVLKDPTGGARRYLVSRGVPAVLTFGTIAGLRSVHPGHATHGSASEPEAAIWVPTIAQRLEHDRYIDEHLAIFMPYLWVDDPVAFASGREVYGFAKTQGWMPRLGDPRDGSHPRLPDPPESLALDVYGAEHYGNGAEMRRCRLITIDREPRRRGDGPAPDPGVSGEVDHGEDLSSLAAFIARAAGAPSGGPPTESASVRRSGAMRGPLTTAVARGATLAELFRDQVVRHVLLKQVRDAEHGELAALQQIVEARSSVLPGTLRWRRLRGAYGVSVEQLASHPLAAELGLPPEQTVRLAFVAEFGFRMDAGVVRWPGGRAAGRQR
ncbi:MAG: NAD(P)-binding protein [Solirubrobacteraceae bacterium]